MGLLTTETIKLLGSTKNKISRDENGENMSHLKIIEIILVHCNIVKNDYQRDSRVLFTSVPNKSFGQSLDISPNKFKFLKIFRWQLLYFEIWHTDQNSKLLEKKYLF